MSAPVDFAPKEWIGTDPRTWGPIFGVSTRKYWPPLSTDGTGYFTSTVWKFRGPCVDHIDPCPPGECSVGLGIKSGYDSYLSALAA